MKTADLVLRLQQLPPNADIVAIDAQGHEHPIQALLSLQAPAPIVKLKLGELSDGQRVKTFIHTQGQEAFRPSYQRFWPVQMGNACPAAGMKPDACNDRSQCLEACGPLGQGGAPAVATLHAPNGLVHACAHHASTVRLQASFLGSHAYVDESPAGTPCTYCAARTH